jgi:hypothetical protein
MKILIIQENGRHEKNRNFRECFCMQRSLVKMNHHVDVWGLGHENYETTPDWNSYDLILNFENYEGKPWIPDLSKTTRPKKMLWSIDAHCVGLPRFLKTFRDGKYNLILQSTEDFVEENSVWFPNCYDHTLIKPAAPKSVFLGFCGSMLNRKTILDLLTSKYELQQDIWKLGDDMVNVVSSYRIHFNKNLSNDINYRSFETIGCETLLLTNYNPQYNKLGFIDGQNCLMYKNVEELCEKLDFCRENPDDLDRISKTGFELSKLHTYDERAKKLISIFKDL